MKITATAGLPIDKKEFQSGGGSQRVTPAAAASLPENLSEMKTLRHLFRHKKSELQGGETRPILRLNEGSGDSEALSSVVGGLGVKVSEMKSVWGGSNACLWLHHLMFFPSG